MKFYQKNSKNPNPSKIFSDFLKKFQKKRPFHRAPLSSNIIGTRNTKSYMIPIINGLFSAPSARDPAQNRSGGGELGQK